MTSTFDEKAAADLEPVGSIVTVEGTVVFVHPDTNHATVEFPMMGGGKFGVAFALAGRPEVGDLVELPATVTDPQAATLEVEFTDIANNRLKVRASRANLKFTRG